MALTLAEAQVLRDAWLAAVQALATGQSYQIGTRSLTRVNLAEAKKTFAEYDQLLASLKNGGTGGVQARRVIPRDL